MPESVLLNAALLLYAASFVMLVRPARGLAALGLAPHHALASAVAVHTLALAWRWAAQGHGPFTTLHEILSSNLWSLSLVLVLAVVLLRGVAELRAAAAAAVPVLAVLALWMWQADPGPGHLPPTYATPLLYLHTLVGKLYLGLLLVATALGLLPTLRRSAWGARHLVGCADDRRCEELAYRFAAFALVFESLMLIVGAVWAQDAWGRYWAWDPLESWAFISWLALVTALHARATLRPSPVHSGWWLALAFGLGFLTFFGVPFISVAPHKGAV